jgi:hypothetical protein
VQFVELEERSAVQCRHFCVISTDSGRVIDRRGARDICRRQQCR